ncbi:SigE family RNA polymerase sigma factor [Nocardioides lentus]|uniref:SigE family RNA polymerase sigma factor n=1 Tax=Nocardioides lentus TaxID=338077 RepID=A0ABN2PQ58_9ACTN
MRREEREAAFADFVATRQSHLRRVAYGVCRDHHQAEDLLQTALVKLYVAWPRVRSADAEAYTRRIIVRAHLDELRRPHRRRERAGLDGHDRAEPAGPAYEDRSALRDALRSLPEQQRKVVVLRHWLGLSVRETAQDLGISEGTVKGYSSRALERLQAALESSGS